MFNNIFVLCTGRCGSTTFIEASKHIKNYSAGHESRSKLLGSERFNYPNSHIEADNRLSWFLGRLDEIYGDTALYVHLSRDIEATAQSFAKRNKGIMAAYSAGILMGAKEQNAYEIAKDYINTVNKNIEFFLFNKKNKMCFSLENANQDFAKFCELIDAEVNLEFALKEFLIKYNASI
jgi:hypothetical protein